MERQRSHPRPPSEPENMKPKDGAFGKTAVPFSPMSSSTPFAIEPHIPVFDKSQRTDGTFSRDDFAYDHKRGLLHLPGRQRTQAARQKTPRVPRPLVDRNGKWCARASQLDCQGCSLKPPCCPNTPARKILRSIHEGARDMARVVGKTRGVRDLALSAQEVEMLFAHLKRILKLDRMRLRGPTVPEMNSSSPPPPKPPQARHADPGGGTDRRDLTRRGAHRRGCDRRSAPPRLLQI